jgi:hypothetical protein
VLASITARQHTCNKQTGCFVYEWFTMRQSVDPHSLPLTGDEGVGEYYYFVKMQGKTTADRNNK